MDDFAAVLEKRRENLSNSIAPNLSSNAARPIPPPPPPPSMMHAPAPTLSSYQHSNYQQSFYQLQPLYEYYPQVQQPLQQHYQPHQYPQHHLQYQHQQLHNYQFQHQYQHQHQHQHQHQIQHQHQHNQHQHQLQHQNQYQQPQHQNLYQQHLHQNQQQHRRHGSSKRQKQQYNSYQSSEQLNTGVEPTIVPIQDQCLEQTLYCEPCDKEFPQLSAYHAHIATHEKCQHAGCAFSGTKKVVSAHFLSAHGIFSGTGFTTIEVEGQQFRVLMGTSPDEVQQWRSDRRKQFPTVAAIQAKTKHSEDLKIAGGIADKPTSRGIKRKNKGKHTQELGSSALPTPKFSNNGGLIVPPPLTGGIRGSLMKKLLEEEITAEENAILQVFRYLRQCIISRPIDIDG